MNIEGWREAKMLQNDQAVTERDENCNSEECCGCASVSPPLDPHKRKGGRIVPKPAEAPNGLSMKLTPTPMMAAGITRVHQNSGEFILTIELGNSAFIFIVFLSFPVR
jgi:hypothetical protein